MITKPDVLDWIAKARESIEAFGGYISMGGPSVTKDRGDQVVLRSGPGQEVTAVKAKTPSVLGTAKERPEGGSFLPSTSKP